MKIALHTDLFRKHSIEKAIPMIAKAGYKYIELNAIPYWSPHINFFYDNKEKINILQTLLDKYKIKMAAISTNTELAILDRAERMRNVKYCLDAIDMCKQFDCHVICTTFSGNVLLSAQKQKSTLIESLKQISEAGQKNDVDIAIEVHPGNFINSTLRAINIIKSLNLPNVGYLFCVPHIVTYAGEDCEHALKVANDHIIHFHLSDTPKTANDHKHMGLGKGEVNFESLISKIKQTGHDRVLTLEIYSEDKHPIDSAINSREILENLLNRN